jgi:hypothetical protein
MEHLKNDDVGYHIVSEKLSTTFLYEEEKNLYLAVSNRDHPIMQNLSKSVSWKSIGEYVRVFSRKRLFSTQLFLLGAQSNLPSKGIQEFIFLSVPTSRTYVHSASQR